MNKKFIVYFLFKPAIIDRKFEGTFEIEADDEVKAKKLANEILDCIEGRVKIEEVKIADKQTGYFVD